MIFKFLSLLFGQSLSSSRIEWSRAHLPSGRLALHGAMHIIMHIVFLNTRAEVNRDFQFYGVPTTVGVAHRATHAGPVA